MLVYDIIKMPINSESGKYIIAQRMVIMSYVPVKIDDFRHEKMKRIAGNDRGAIIKEYRNAIDFYIAYKTKETMIQDTGLESFINEKINKVENHLASMLARNGMDNAMSLMGLLIFLEKFFNGKYTREELQEKLRIEGARYFTGTVQKDKEKKKEE